LNWLSFFLRVILTVLQLGNNWEQFTFKQVHSIPLRTHTGVRIDVQRCRHVRMPKLSLCNFQRRPL